VLFNSYAFIFQFLPATLLTFFILYQFRSSHVLLQLVLAASSVIFYVFSGTDRLWILLLSITVNYFVGRALSSPRGKKSHRQFLIALGVAFNLSLLVFFKYWNFLAENISLWTDWSIPRLNIELPLAISFFTFLQIAYIVDCYRHRQAERYAFLEYGLFVVFFPHLIAGPLVHHRKLILQFRELRTRSKAIAHNLAAGLSIFVIGLSKKVLIADCLSTPANTAFNAASTGLIDPGLAAFGILSYTLQIYFDFSGYSDMAIGLSRFFGIQLPENFNSPYQAKNIIDFWRRWHITLSDFLRDYLYIPLGGNRQGRGRRYLNLMITMLLGGLWHGAGWNFLIWGGLHGLYLCINHAYRHFVPKQPRAFEYAYPVVTMAGVMFAWIFFRANTFTEAANMIRSLFSEEASSSTDVFTPRIIGTAILATLVASFFPNSGMIFNRWKDTDIAGKFIPARFSMPWLRWQPTIAWLFFILLMTFASLIFLDTETPEFIYYKF